MGDPVGNVRDLLQGTPFGETFPARPNPPPLSVDGRTAVLRVLKRYIAALVFYLPGGRNDAGVALPARPIRIPPEDIHIEWPDNEASMRFPSIVFLSTAPAEYDAIGLTAYLEEKTRDVHGLGTVLQWQSEYVENLAVEIWASKKAERRSILAGLETALTPTEQMYGLRFKVPDYYGELVCFTVQSRELFDETDAVRNRRRARLVVQVRFNIVALVNYAELTTVAKTSVDVDEDTNMAVTIDVNAPSDDRPPTLPRVLSSGLSGG